MLGRRAHARMLEAEAESLRHELAVSSAHFPSVG